MRPEDLADELGIDGKRLRGWLRKRFPRHPGERGLPWFLTDEQVAEARRFFVNAGARHSRLVIERPATRSTALQARPATPNQSRFTWFDFKRHADAVLAAGLRTLMAQPAAGWGAVDVHEPGIYVFTLGAVPLYVGEATAVSLRVAQHRDPGSRFMLGLTTAGGLDVSRLSVRALPVHLGRLELEEYAIACLRPTANRMRLTSRSAMAYDDADQELWTRVQADAPRLLREGVRAACDIPRVPWSAMLPPAGPGLYIVRDSTSRPIYVGESDALDERLETHGGSRSYFSALRRHVGTEILDLSFAPDVRRGFSPTDEAAITSFLASCTIAILPLTFGRGELERDLVHELRPTLNREHTR